MAVPSTSSASKALDSPAWMGRLIRDCEMEGEFEAKWRIIILEDLARSALWQMCSELGVEKHGVPGQACRMLEKYLARYLRQNLHLFSDPDAWTAFKQALMSRFFLLMATCIRLATKMSSSNLLMTAARIRSYLASKSVTYSHRQVCSAETEIYQMLVFNIPLWTSVEVGLMLAKSILKMPYSTLTSISALVNLCELYRNKIERSLDWINSTSMRSLRTLHLTAGAVLASNELFGDDRRDYTVKLATHTRIHPHYLKSLVHTIILLIETLTHDTEGPSAAKRKKTN